MGGSECVCGEEKGGGSRKECLQSVSHSGPSDAYCVYLLLSLVEMRSEVTAAHPPNPPTPH